MNKHKLSILAYLSSYSRLFLMDIMPCPIDGNGDLYGLGLRLGLYFQGIATVLSKVYIGAEFKVLQTTTLAFVFANWCVLANRSVGRTILSSKFLAMCLLLTPQMAPAQRVALVSFRDVATALLSFLIACLEMWFAYQGLDVLPRSPCGREYGFFFAQVDLRGWYRTVLKVFGCIFLVITIGNLYFTWQGFKKVKAIRGRLTHPLLPLTPQSLVMDRHALNLDVCASMTDRGDEALANESLQVYNVFSIPQVLLMLFSIPGTELVLHWNRIGGVRTVDSVTQLTPLLLGLGQLVYTLVALARRYASGELRTTLKQAVNAIENPSTLLALLEGRVGYNGARPAAQCRACTRGSDQDGAENMNMEL